MADNITVLVLWAVSTPIVYELGKIRGIKAAEPIIAELVQMCREAREGM